MCFYICLVFYVCFDFYVRKKKKKDEKDSTIKYIEDLPRGNIGMVLIGDPQFYVPGAKDESSQFIDNHPWATATCNYKIFEVLRYPDEFILECDGSTMEFFYKDENVEKTVLGWNFVRETIKKWNEKYSELVMEPYSNKQSNYSAFSVQQPIAEAILRGVKKSEGRSNPLFKLQGSDLNYIRNVKEKWCKLCPSENGSLLPSKCTNILHVGSTLAKYNIKNSNNNDSLNRSDTEMNNTSEQMKSKVKERIFNGEILDIHVAKYGRQNQVKQWQIEVNNNDQNLNNQYYPSSRYNVHNVEQKRLNFEAMKINSSKRAARIQSAAKDRLLTK